MARFDFKKVKNPVNTHYESSPMTEKGEKLEPIGFTLKPVDTDIAFMVRRWRYTEYPANREALAHAIGCTRVVDWVNVLDENGKPVEFNLESFRWFLNMHDTIDYMIDVGVHTIREIIEDEEIEDPNGKKEEQAPPPSQPQPEDPTSGQS